MNKKVLLSGDCSLQLRFLCPQDAEEVKQLFLEWFPIKYPDCWFHKITSDPKFYSLAAVYKSRIVGLVVSELKPLNKCSKEDQDILCSRFLNTAFVAYILTLGVDKEYRRNGIGSLLLDNLIAHVVTSPDTLACKALYLHALTTNIAAIAFYERKNFKPHSYLPSYYSINGESVDGFSYVLYVNNGFPPWGFQDYIQSVASSLLIYPCAMAKKSVQVMHTIIRTVVVSRQSIKYYICYKGNDLHSFAKENILRLNQTNWLDYISLVKLGHATAYDRA